jgi:Flp pilus assembly protein CpaB
MMTARFVVLMTALCAGGDACIAGGSDNKPPPVLEPVVNIQTFDVLVAKSEIGLGRLLKPEDLQGQSRPAAAAGTLIHRNEPRDASQTTGARGSGTLALTLRSDTDANTAEAPSDGRTPMRGDGVIVVRNGLPGTQTAQK